MGDCAFTQRRKNGFSTQIGNSICHTNKLPVPLFQNEDKKSKAGGSKNYNRVFLHDPFLFFQRTKNKGKGLKKGEHKQ
eukprot:scaffold4040_cov287-Ochromonas_danica.AAC.1